MWNFICALMAALGFLISGIFLLGLIITGVEKFQAWNLRRETLQEAVNTHHSDIAKLKMQVVFLERCERERTNRENEASRKAAKKKGSQ